MPPTPPRPTARRTAAPRGRHRPPDHPLGHAGDAPAPGRAVTAYDDELRALVADMVGDDVRRRRRRAGGVPDRGRPARCSSSTAPTPTGERTVGVVCNPEVDAARGPRPAGSTRTTRAACPSRARYVPLRAARLRHGATGTGLDGAAGDVQRRRAARPLPPARDRPHAAAPSSATGCRRAGARSSRRPTSRPPTTIPPTGRRSRHRRLTGRRSASAGGDVAGHGGGRGDVERVDALAHRDDRAPVGGLLPARRQPVALGAEHEGDPVEPGDGLLDRRPASSARVSATVVKPRAARSGRASYQSGRRVHGVVNTAPMPTLIERR